jgi:3-methyladenine DNA glycosylase AlkC
VPANAPTLEPFKNLINAGTVRDMSHHLHRVWPDFPSKRFEKLALDRLDELEFKARAKHLRTALQATLPADFDHAADIIEASLAPTTHDAALSTFKADGAGLAGWALWPMCDYIATSGIDHPKRAMQALCELTQRHTAEWSIRPFIEQHEKLAMATLATWTKHKSEHVRRLVSEGSRPRLPWGLQLKHLIADPSPTLPLLEALQDDPSEYVRRSVANHLNDIAKDHPDIVVDWVERFLPQADAPRRALLKHASRTLIKKGHARMLGAWGLGERLRGTAGLALSAKKVSVGDSLVLTATLGSTAARPQKLVIDYAVHHVKANGDTSAKVFKGWNVALAPRETRTLTKSHSMRLITTRRYHAGAHAVDLRINGEIVASASFQLTL